MIRDEDEKKFAERIEWASKQDEYPVVLMSCIQGFNKDLFLE